MRRLFLLAVLLATSTACTPMPPNAKPSTPYPPRLAQCQADAGQPYIGQAATDEVIAQAKAATGANTVRVLKPGMAMTMDYRDDRLNLELDDHGAVVKVSCG